MKTAVYFERFLTVVGLGVFALSFNSCSEDFDFEDAKKNNPQYEYSQNFIDKFGAIDPNQSWDFYGMNVGTRATGDPIVSTSEDYYSVQNETLTWMKEQLKEGNNGTNNWRLGDRFTLQMIAEEFVIVPIYQGQAGMQWDLHMVVGTGDSKTDTKIWSKSQGIETSTNGNSWTNLATSGNTMNAGYVRSKYYTVSNIEHGKVISFYLDITSGTNNWANKGTKQPSTGVPNNTVQPSRHTMTTMMLALDCPTPSNLTSQGYTCWIIGCEDANLKSSDWDYNDVVFLVYGKPRPEQIIITETGYWQPRTKRYMVEDLGSTDDFDFNDIVVDLKDQRWITVTKENGIIVSEEPGEWGQNQKATVYSLGGTLDFDFMVAGTTVFKKSTAKTDGKLSTTYNDGYFSTNNISSGMMYNTGREGEDGDSHYVVGDKISNEFSISGWNFDQNNVSFKVYRSPEKTSNAIYDGDATEITFPKNGEIPYIMAFRSTQDWNTERVSVFNTASNIDYSKFHLNTTSATGE